ncbi:neugrin [Latimeria chalumnae]|uniref:Neugrin n=1 Tax=Latimeria chalumnae TaxID=7897 RepID=H3B9P0_LATCH|nr:PREDICTED: neugrin [Latimeria chalumnae]|eukprot:XP_005989824.1 PREDICTED: neugrin [Latimeria chalumnae]
MWALLSRLACSRVPPALTRVPAAPLSGSPGDRTRDWTAPKRVTTASARRRQEEEEEEEEEQLYPEIQELISAKKRIRKVILYKRMRAEFEPPGPPERTLTWNAINQIRYLSQEFPDEWPVPRLAEGFSVSPDVIQRVLRSKFMPSPRRQLKQDDKVQQKAGGVATTVGTSTGNETLQKLPAGERGVARLPSRETELPSVRTDLLKQREGFTLGPERSAFTPKAVGASAVSLIVQNRPDSHKAETGKNSAQVQKGRGASEELSVTSEVEEEEEWEGDFLSEEELKRLMESGVENRMKVVQKGADFYDADGNFLYRIFKN